MLTRESVPNEIKGSLLIRLPLILIFPNIFYFIGITFNLFFV